MLSTSGIMKRTSISRKPRSCFLIIFCKCPKSHEVICLALTAAQDEHWPDAAEVMTCNAIWLVSWWQCYRLLHRCLRKSQLSPVCLGKCKSRRGKPRNWAKISRGSNVKSKFSRPEMSPKILTEMTFQDEWAAKVEWQSWKINLLNLTDQVSTLKSTTDAIQQE